MKPLSFVVVRRSCCAAALLCLAVSAHAAGAQCILAGRVDGNQRWAPRAAGVELLNQQGARIRDGSRDGLARVQQVRVSREVLLSTCDGNAELAAGPEAPQAKTAVPAISPGKALIAVEALNFPKLRVGGELVELQLAVPPDRVVMLSR